MSPVVPLAIGVVLGHVGLLDWFTDAIPQELRLVLAGLGLALIVLEALKWRSAPFREVADVE
ncbi:hypothetical protein ACFQO4_20735 [Saliphagus sp. GCM10025334]